jgi:hypothetical protein
MFKTTYLKSYDLDIRELAPHPNLLPSEEGTSHINFQNNESLYIYDL